MPRVTFSSLASLMMHLVVFVKSWPALSSQRSKIFLNTLTLFAGVLSTFFFQNNNNNNNFLSSARLHISVQHKRFLFFPILTVALCEVPVALFPLYILHCLCNVHAIYLNINRGFTAKLFRQK